MRWSGPTPGRECSSRPSVTCGYALNPGFCPAGGVGHCWCASWTRGRVRGVHRLAGLTGGGSSLGRVLLAPREDQAVLFGGAVPAVVDEAGVLRRRVTAVVRAHFVRCAAGCRGRPEWPNAWMQHCAVVRSLLVDGHDDDAVLEALWRSPRLTVADVGLRLGRLPELGWKAKGLERRINRSDRPRNDSDTRANVSTTR